MWYETYLTFINYKNIQIHYGFKLNLLVFNPSLESLVLTYMGPALLKIVEQEHVRADSAPQNCYYIVVRSLL